MFLLNALKKDEITVRTGLVALGLLFKKLEL